MSAGVKDSKFVNHTVRALFCQESIEMLEQGERALYDLMRCSDYLQLIDTIHRAAHAIKSNAMMVGYGDIAHFTQLFLDGLQRCLIHCFFAESALLCTGTKALRKKAAASSTMIFRHALLMLPVATV